MFGGLFGFWQNGAIPATFIVWMFAVISLLLHGYGLLLRYLKWNMFPACLACYHHDLTTQEISIQVVNINCYSPPKPSLYVCLN
jgi:hypothetical protein